MATTRTFLRKRQACGNGASHDPAEIARVAYELYEQRGRSHGHDLGDWFKAEEIIRQRTSIRPSW